MLSGKELRDYRELRGLSLREVADYCDVSFQLIGQVENGQKDVTEHNHREITNGINCAYFAKCNNVVKDKPVILSVEKQQEDEISMPKTPLSGKKWKRGKECPTIKI